MGSRPHPGLVGRPLVFITVAILLGVAAQPWLWPLWMEGFILSTALAVCGIRLHLMLSGLFVGLAAVFLGSGFAPTEVSAEVRAGTVHWLQGRVVEAPNTQEGRTGYLISDAWSAREQDGRFRALPGRVMLWVPGGGCGAPGDRIRARVRLKRVRDRGFEGEISRERQALATGYLWRATASASSWCQRLPGSEYSLPSSIERLRVRVQSVVSSELSGDTAAVVRGFAIGDRSQLSPSTRDAFLKSGLTHVLAVSGLNLTLVIGLIWSVAFWGLARFPGTGRRFAPRRWASAVALAVIPLYTLFAGAAPSAVRAAVMAGWMLLAQLLGRGFELKTAMWGGAVVFAIWNPGIVFSISFQLSMTAVLGLVYVFPALRRPFQETGTWWSRPADVVLASLAASLSTLPVLAYHFQWVSWVSLVSNLPCAPLAGALVPLSLGAGLLSAVSPEHLAWTLIPVGWLADLLIGLTHWFGDWPGAQIAVSRPALLEIAVYYLALFGALSKHLRLRRIAWGLVIGLAVSSLWPAGEAARVTFLPVGDGDSAVLEFAGKVAVVDTGPEHRAYSAVESVLIPFLRSRGLRSVDVLILTHAHRDHTGGLAHLAEAVSVKEVWHGPGWTAANLARLSVFSSARLRAVSRGHEVSWVGGRLKLLWPPKGFAGDANRGSIALKVEHGASTLLMMGDTDETVEAALMQLETELQADVLKLGHHGSRTSSSKAFLEHTRAREMIVSSGRHSRFGFPHPSVVRGVRETGARLWVTGHRGRLTLGLQGSPQIQSFYPAEHAFSTNHP